MLNEVVGFVRIANSKIQDINSNPTHPEYENKLKQVEDELKNNLLNLLIFNDENFRSIK